MDSTNILLRIYQLKIDILNGDEQSVQFHAEK